MIFILFYIFFAIHLNFVSAQVTKVCPEGWKQFQNKCFLFYPDKSFLNYYEAHLVCKDFMNATLASIHSEDEQKFISKLSFVTNKAENHVWIGARRTSRDKFVWEDNSAFNYTNWAKSQPNNLDGKHYCASLLYSPNALELGLWYDDPCGDRYHVVCQLNLESKQTPTPIVLPTNPPLVPNRIVTTTTPKMITTFKELRDVYNKTLTANSTTISALINAKADEPDYSNGTNISLIIVSVFEFLIIVSLVYVVFKRNPLPYRTLVMSECNRNSVQNNMS